ncbi:MAG TPA: TetR/AcrR family transcriptional regulator [Caulobacteraceae bacterium]
MARQKTISDEAVLDAAMGVMFAKGPSDFTLADIAQAAGIAPATLVQRFGDKRRLILATLARDNEMFARILAELPINHGAAAVIAVLRLLTPDIDDAGVFSDQLLWLRQDMRDPDLNRLARERFEKLREAIAPRLPPLAIAPAKAALLVEAQWQGALNQWGIAPEGRLVDFVTRSLAAWFTLVGGASQSVH